jgi:hypothetical protein
MREIEIGVEVEVAPHYGSISPVFSSYISAGISGSAFFSISTIYSASF